MYQTDAAITPHDADNFGQLTSTGFSRNRFPPSGGTASNGFASSGEDVTRHLRDRYILLVEDEALVAMDLAFALRDAGSHVIGPASSLNEALEFHDEAERVDGAILDVDLGGEDVFPLARNLAERSVPFVFYTGVGSQAQMQAFLPLARVCLKPAPIDDLLADLAGLLALRRGS